MPARILAASFAFDFEITKLSKDKVKAIMWREAFGEFLTRHREKLGLTQTEVARRVGLSLSYIINLEQGKDPTGKNKKLKPPIEVVDQIAKALNLPVNKVRRIAGHETTVKDKNSVNEIPQDDAEAGFERSMFFSLYEEYQKLSPKQQSEFNRILEMLSRELRYIRREETDTPQMQKAKHKKDSFFVEA